MLLIKKLTSVIVFSCLTTCFYGFSSAKEITPVFKRARPTTEANSQIADSIFITPRSIRVVNTADADAHVSTPITDGRKERVRTSLCATPSTVLPQKGPKTTLVVKRAKRYQERKQLTDAQMEKKLDFWVQKYLHIRKMQKLGMQGETLFLHASELKSNNTKEKPDVFEVELTGIKDPVRTRPDIVSHDLKLVIEIKTLTTEKPGRVFCNTRQLRAQRQHAGSIAYKHYLIFYTRKVEEPNGFIRPSGPLSNSSSEIRLYNSKGILYKWVKTEQSRKRKNTLSLGKWIKETS